MTKDEVDHQLDTSWELPETVSRLKKVVEEIEECVPGDRTKELMYELVEIVLECGERVHEMESRLMAGSPVESSKQRDERIRIDVMKDQRKGVVPKNTYRPYLRS